MRKLDINNLCDSVVVSTAKSVEVGLESQTEHLAHSTRPSYDLAHFLCLDSYGERAGHLRVMPSALCWVIPDLRCSPPITGMVAVGVNDNTHKETTMSNYCEITEEIRSLIITSSELPFLAECFKSRQDQRESAIDALSVDLHNELLKLCKQHPVQALVAIQTWVEDWRQRGATSTDLFDKQDLVEIAVESLADMQKEAA